MNKIKTGPKKINNCGKSMVLQRQRHSFMKNKSFKIMLKVGVFQLLRQVTLRHAGPRSHQAHDEPLIRTICVAV